MYHQEDKHERINSAVQFNINDECVTQSTMHDRDDISVPAHVLWYSSEDYLQFRQDAAREENQLLETETTPTSCRRDFVQHLLHQQSEHKLLGISDPKGLQVVSKTYSKSAAVRAHKTALKVAVEVGSPVQKHRKVPGGGSSYQPTLRSIRRRAIAPHTA